jgi:general L-amino acid transport system permease protein
MTQVSTASSARSASVAPPRSPRAFAWARHNLFRSVGDTCITIILAILVGVLIAALVRWLFLDAAWRGATLADCPVSDAACWPFLHARFLQFIYGFYPAAERWRINVAFVLGGLIAGSMLLRPVRRHFAIVTALLLLWPIAAAVLMHGGVFGLVAIDTTRWGGFSLTFFMAATAAAVALPLGILLALARRSRHAAVRALAVGWIEFWRAVPMLPVLFVAVSMFPLFMPESVELDRFSRAMAAFTIVTSCFLAEAIRGGLQAIPSPQYEAAYALGMGHWRTMRFIILPQAFAIALPSMVNVVIVLFKDTTLVNVIGIFCLLGMVQAAATSPQWMSEQSVMTGYALVAAIYWLCCFAMSRIGLRLEARLARGRGDNGGRLF